MQVGWSILIIYEVERIFFFKRRKEVYRVFEKDVKENVEVSSSDQNYYVEEIKELFKIYEFKRCKDASESMKQQALAEWDGVIYG